MMTDPEILNVVSAYNVWRTILARCTNTRNKSYRDYGGRGITLCNQWKASFLVFYRDIGPRPSHQHTLDRIDNDKGYFPDNCRWATHIEQSNNRRNTPSLTISGETRTFASWARRAGITIPAFHARVRRKWPTSDLLLPKKHRRESIVTQP